MLVAVVPEEQALVLRDASDFCSNYVHYIQKVPKRVRMNESTYFLPSGKSFGLRRSCFKREKNNSQAAMLKL